MERILVDIYVIDGGPGHEGMLKPALRLVNGALGELSEKTAGKVTVRWHVLGSQAQAERCRVPGSPTIKVDGADVCWNPSDEGAWCYGSRIYMNIGEILRLPPMEALRERILDAAARRLRRLS